MSKQAARQCANQTFWFMWVFIVVIIVFPAEKAVRWIQRKLLLPCSMLFLQAQVSGRGFCTHRHARGWSFLSWLESPILASLQRLWQQGVTCKAAFLSPPHCSTREPRRETFLAGPALSGSGRRQLPPLLHETPMASLQFFLKVDIQNQPMNHVAAKAPVACHWGKRQLKPFEWESPPRKGAQGATHFLEAITCPFARASSLCMEGPCACRCKAFPVYLHPSSYK